MSVCSVGLIIQRNVNNFLHLSVVFRTAVVDRLLANGSSRSWLLGIVLVTVTVSKRTPSNMPCAYCSSGKAFLSESLPRVRSSSSSQCRTRTKSANASDHTSVESEGLPYTGHEIWSIKVKP